jgi:hypothetical protein
VPLNRPLLSIAITSRGSSTTQMTVSSLRASLHMEQDSPSEMLKQVEQNLTLSLTSTIARASSTASSLGMERMKKAILCADLGPIPGSPQSLSIRFSSGAA